MNTREQFVNRRFLLVSLLGLGLLLIFSLLSLWLGAVHTSLAQLWQVFNGEGIVFEYRLPRLTAAILVGMNLAVAGSMMQSITRNPMAAPDLIGINAGAGLVIVLLILTVPEFSPIVLPVAAFVGAAAAGGLVYALAYRKKGFTNSRLVLSGLAVGSGLHALITLVLVKYAPNASQALVFLKGSFYALSWERVAWLAPWTILGIPLAFFVSRHLTLLQLDESVIAGLGIRVNRMRLMLLALVVVLAGSAVAIAGTIAFVGLIVPHLVKYVIGPNYKLSTPLCALFGALLVVMSDMIGRIVMPPAELPAGIVTAILGAPYFLYLLVKKS
ncbi:iron ABC transporter permease [Paenibacillus sp. SYP-B3998]|uniref:Iron ABC transporter permease n=1 Tax=Paenibacillus sp. SYP-B3998 TaxID=2678564 RepID=A0A6G3ZSA7_9BACL|nr:iron ABC transporter permease [Paenibacillus sp. SYP-B3998]NEW05005.1 iron ABC transporter permease [Paenibacillus sp. SYP-B3998]